MGIAGLVRQTDELSVQGLLGAGPADAVLLRADVPDEWLRYLRGCGLELPRLLRHPTIAPRARFVPFGWSDEAIELNRRHERPVEHPARECIRRVNSRSFAQQLEAELFPGGAPATTVERLEELEAWLVSAPAADWMLKAEFGNAGLGNRRLRGSRLRDADRRFVVQRLAEDDRIVVEPWLHRVRDWCMVFEVPFDPARFRLHETVMTADGALIGALFGGAEPPAATLEELRAAARRIAERLDGEGYFGPVCVDAFEWRGGGKTRLRPLVDLNCRRSMSDGAHRLWRRLLPGRTVYYRFFARGKLSVGEELSGLPDRLRDRRFDPVARCGILFASPPLVESRGRRRAPGKLALLIVADSAEDVFAQERWFRRRFER